MSGVDHLPSEEYRRSARRSPGSRLCLRAHQHLVSTCPQCGEGWGELGHKLQGLVLQELAAAPPLTPPAEPHPDDLPGSDEAVDRLATQAAGIRRRRRRAKKQLSELRQLAAARRADKVRGAYRRFRSRLLAELLIEEARAVVRNAPDEAHSFASLVPLVLDWAQSEEHAAWAPTLIARAAAHQANALRVAGELAAAERIFDQLDVRDVGDVAVRGEILSLEGSLRSDQRKFEMAETVLQRAAEAYEYAGDRLGVAKVRIQQGILMRVLCRTEEVLRHFEAAASDLGEEAAPELAVATTTGRVNALCDLGRPLEARRVLHAGLDAFEEIEAPFVAAHFRTLEGRISLGLADYSAAEDYFRAAIATMQIVGRPHDAATTSLLLAEVLLEQGRAAELRRLASGLIKEFQEREVGREIFKALQLFGKAVATEQLTATILERIRRTFLNAT